MSNNELNKAIEETRKYASGEVEMNDSMIAAWNATGNHEWVKLVAIYNQSEPFRFIDPTPVSKETAWDNCFEFAMHFVK